MIYVCIYHTHVYNYIHAYIRVDIGMSNICVYIYACIKQENQKPTDMSAFMCSLERYPQCPKVYIIFDISKRNNLTVIYLFFWIFTTF